MLTVLPEHLKTHCSGLFNAQHSRPQPIWGELEKLRTNIWFFARRTKSKNLVGDRLTHLVPVSMLLKMKIDFSAFRLRLVLQTQ